MVGLRRLSIGAGCKAPRSCRIGMRIILRWNVRFPRSRAWRAHRCSARTPSGRPVRRASTRRMPRRSSGWAIGFEITGWPRRSCRAAPENEPVSMTRTKASIADRSRGPGARDSGPHLSGQGCSDPNALDPATRTLMTEIDLLNPDGELSPGTYCTVELKIPRRTPVTDRAGRSKSSSTAMASTCSWSRTASCTAARSLKLATWERRSRSATGSKKATTWCSPRRSS